MNYLKNHYNMEKNIFKGFTKNDIRHAYFMANLFNEPIEEVLKPVVFTDEHYKVKSDEYFEMICQGMVDGKWDDEQDYILQQFSDYPKY